jgi:acetyl esterase/lipase
MKKIILKTKNYLELHLLDGEKRPLVIVAPGGGYEFTSEREAMPIVNVFNANGFHAAIVYYRETMLMYPESVQELADFVSEIRQANLPVIPDQIYLIGFSSGGHYVASLGVEHQLYGENSRPNAMILAYPVITGKQGYAHDSSIKKLYGEITDATRAAFSLEDKVNIETPPTFLFHTVEDTGVPYQNSLFFFSALNKLGIPTEMHLYEKGPHGISLANRTTPAYGLDPLEYEKRFQHQASWINLAISWLKNLK